jgi:hypothetical protein
MIHKTYEIICRASAQEASDRVRQLLSDEGVKYQSADFTITSLKTPMAVLGIQPNLYSQRNWVGINPFIFISGISVHCETKSKGLTTVTVRVNRIRSFLWVGFWVACSLLAASAMPWPGGPILFIGVACAAWFGLVSFVGGYLIKKEIDDHLKYGGYPGVVIESEFSGQK